MPAAIIDGIKTAQQIKDEVKGAVSALAARGVFPKLAVVLAGSDPASLIYIRNKKKACEYTGIGSEIFELKASAAESDLLDLIARLNDDKTVSGVLVQSPLPAHINAQNAFAAVSPEKDVDCFNPVSVGLLSVGTPTFLPCTPAGVIELLKRYNIEISGKNCVILGRSNIVGKPMFNLLLRENATVTVCHSKTRDLPGITKRADILISAAGAEKIITADMLKEGAVVIDVGINKNAQGRLCGDVDFDACARAASFITPVPGGVGPMTVAMLMKNCVKAVDKS